MSVDVRESIAHTFTFHPDTVWSVASAAVLSPAGATLESPTPTLPSASSSVSAAVSSSEFTVGTAISAFDTPGHRVLVTDAASSWESAIGVIRSYDSATGVMRLAHPLPDTPSTSATLALVTVTVTAAAISTLGHGYRVIIRNTTTNEEIPQAFSVVKMPWINPIDPLRVRTYIADNWASHPILENQIRLVDFAAEAGDLLRSRLLNLGGYAHRFWDSRDMLEAGKVAMRLVLADAGLFPPGAEPTEYMRSKGFDLRDRVAELVASATPQDRDDDNALSTLEEQGSRVAVMRL